MARGRRLLAFLVALGLGGSNGPHANAEPQGRVCVQSEATVLPIGRSNRAPCDDELRGLELLYAAASAAGRSLTPHDPRVLALVAAGDSMSLRSPHAVHRVLHEQILRGEYRDSGFDVIQTLDSGHYNCLTATILLKVLGDLHGVPLQLVASPRHVATMLPDGSPVEATCPEWFDHSLSTRVPPTGAVIRASATATETSVMGLSAPQNEKPTVIDGWQLVARVHFNRGLEALGRSEFSQARDQFALAAQRDPQFIEARQNQFAALNRWALQLVKLDDYRTARDRLDEARTLDSHSPLLHANLRHVDHAWALWLCRHGRHRDALEILAEGRRQQPEAEFYATAAEAVGKDWIATQKSSEQRDAVRQQLHNLLPLAALPKESCLTP